MPHREFRRATTADYEAILRLQAANYIAALSEDDRRQGFLSAEFSRSQIAAMAEDLGIMIAVEAGVLAGYLCAFRNEFNHGSPVLAEMLKSYDRLRYRGKALSAYNSYVYGPVCVGRPYRQRGILRGLYEAQKRDLAGRFDIGVAFVARNNPHSLQAHVAGVGMDEVGDFEVKHNIYVILAFPLPRQP
ncbi:MAG TPA: hypothetical protein VE131_07430 [Terriglobales bacterium]|jgi:predicted GNAT superfamily acetyltransferase|nr:hypothetical protein [Terriglobales bacterium]